MIRATTGLMLVFAAVACVGGCGDSSKGTISGEVTLDGQPLPEGTMRFVPVDGKSQTASAAISRGHYTATGVPTGEHRIEISAPKVLGKRKMYDTPDSPTVDEVGELLPGRYNVKSELTLTVKAGRQSKDFPLSSK